MKKIDLHIHTVQSITDKPFEFSLESLSDYVSKLDIDCIAITNHNLFDLSQFQTIASHLSIKVMPGIEIDLEKGHLLLISENDNLEDFSIKCKKVENLITNREDSITYEQLVEIFENLNEYLLIPHYDKKPNVKEETLIKLEGNIFCGEVTSIRKFKSCIKDKEKLTPVLFSDCRFVDDMDSYPTRQTYIDVEELSLNSIKGCLFDKNKVFTSKEDGNEIFQATDDGIKLSTGLNVIIGERSSGKTYTLNKISNNFENVKYIKQFSLLQNDSEDFDNFITSQNSLVTEGYLTEFKRVVSDVINVDLETNDLKLEKYLYTLKKYASESDKLDAYSKCKIYNESHFEIENLTIIKELIKATKLLIDTVEYRGIINKHIERQTLINLLKELILTHNKSLELNYKKKWVNDLTDRIKEDLHFRSTATSVDEIDFKTYITDKIKVDKFEKLVKLIQTEKNIDSKEIRGFKIVVVTRKFDGASKLKNKSRRQFAFSDAFKNYEYPYKYLQSLKKVGLEDADLYKYFVNIEYQTLNKYGFQVSGGERSEFNLLREISDALKYDLLLIDEPESSFDNVFLKNDVNELIKDIAKEIPVIVVTHNNTIGASIKPDYMVYTQKKIVDKDVIYDVYFGHPTSKELQNSKGEKIENLEILMKCLEAGKEAYYERKKENYEILENRK